MADIGVFLSGSRYSVENQDLMEDAMNSFQSMRQNKERLLISTWFHMQLYNFGITKSEISFTTLMFCTY